MACTKGRECNGCGRGDCGPWRKAFNMWWTLELDHADIYETAKKAFVAGYNVAWAEADIQSEKDAEPL